MTTLVVDAVVHHSGVLADEVLDVDLILLIVTRDGQSGSGLDAKICSLMLEEAWRGTDLIARGSYSKVELSIFGHLLPVLLEQKVLRPRSAAKVECGVCR